jgi:hypothetical protein
VIEELERDLVGLAPVKQRIREIAAFLAVAPARAMASSRSRRACT